MKTWLQGIGEQDAKPAKDLQVGDTLVWNYGYTSEVVAILSETKCFITIQTLSHSNNQLYERRLCKTHLIGIKS